MFKEYVATPSIKVLEKKAPNVYIYNKAIQKMKSYIDLCSDEIGWLGSAYKDPQGNYIITDTFLFEQDVSSSTTEITPEGLAVFGTELLNKENGVELWNSIKVWGHSHVNMSPSPSGQDNDQMETFADNQQDWFIRIIANKKGEMKLDLYDFEYGVIFENLKFQAVYNEEETVLYNQIQELQKKFDEILDANIVAVKEGVALEIKAKVSSKSKVTTYSSESYLNYNFNDYYGRGNEYYGYGNTVSKKKQIEEEAGLEEIKTDHDVYALFSDIEMIGFSMCSDYFQFSGEFIDTFGEDYTDNEMLTIFRASKKFAGDME